MTSSLREEKRYRIARKLARKLDDAADAMESYLDACEACHDGTGLKNADDSRVTLKRDMREFAHWLATKYPEVDAC